MAGGALAAWISGSGPPALILHGGPGLGDYTDTLADELGASFTGIRYQQRGVPPTTVAGPYSVETHIADAVAVLDALTIESALVVGHSWGGHLAMHLALAHPGRLTGMLVVEPLGAVPDGGMEALAEALTSRIPATDAVRATELDEQAMRGAGSPEEALESLRLLWPGYFADPATAPPMPDIGISVDCYADTWASVQEHFERETLVRGLPACDVPALFLMGRESPIPYAVGVRSAELMRRAGVEVVDGCGHFPWLERGGVVLAAAVRLTSEG